MPGPFGERCWDCRFWDGPANFRASADFDAKAFGECREGPPQPYEDVFGKLQREWPVTRPSDWCGKFQAWKESK